MPGCHVPVCPHLGHDNNLTPKHPFKKKTNELTTDNMSLDDLCVDAFTERTTAISERMEEMKELQGEVIKKLSVAHGKQVEKSYLERMNEVGASIAKIPHYKQKALLCRNALDDIKSRVAALGTRVEVLRQRKDNDLHAARLKREKERAQLAEKAQKTAN